MGIPIESRSRKLIEELGLGRADEVVSVTPLTGGVSSDIALVDLGDRKICVKFALKQLKVAEQWYANVERSRAEYNWLEFASSIVPESTPVLMGQSDAANGFAMEFIEGEDVYLWKNALLQQQADRGEAEKVGHTLGKIHSASSSSGSVKKRFQNQRDFFALRLSPYLCFTAERHPGLSAEIKALVEMLENNQRTLIHGDVSPKNIIFRQGSPVILDAECATIGDPCFDVAFCLNHLVLKAVHLPSIRRFLLSCIHTFWTAYRPWIDWEPAAGLEQRTCRLLPALMLARVDGKSPVEYLDDAEQSSVRALAVTLLNDFAMSLAGFVDRTTIYLENN